MKKYGYKEIKVKRSDLVFGLNKIKKDKLLNKFYLNYKKTGEGTHQRLSDPSNQKTGQLQIIAKILS